MTIKYCTNPKCLHCSITRMAIKKFGEEQVIENERKYSSSTDDFIYFPKRRPRFFHKRHNTFYSAPGVDSMFGTFPKDQKGACMKPSHWIKLHGERCDD